METFVNLEPNAQPTDLVSVEGEVPDDLEIGRLDPKSLPPVWHGRRDESLRHFGDQWIRAGLTVALLVPSAAVQGEWNLLLNPAHRNFGRVKFGRPESFDFDARMFR
jgi:RES domain-containing protein